MIKLVLCIPFILSGSSNECWLHTCDACVITTWRLGLRAPLVARNNPLNAKSDPHQLSPNKISTSPGENILRIIDKTDHQREML